MKKSVLSLAVLAGIAAASIAQAADDTSLTMYGITLYGTYDIGVAYQSHGAPLSQDFYPGLQYLLGKSSNKDITSVAPSGLSQSKIGVRGKETINDDIAFVFNGEIGFNPQSGALADAPRSLIHNNGLALADQKSAGDGSRAGQLFNGQAWAGLSSKEWGTLTFGRHVTLLGETIVKYDPMNGSYAFSPIGYSGMTGGMGDTEDVRLDGSAKYVWKNDMFHAGALYQWGKNDSSPGEAWQGDVGFDYAGFAVDGVYGRKKDALALGSLSAAQVAGNASATPPVAPLPRDSLAATVSDNESWTIAGSWTGGPWKLSAGFEHIKYSNPALPLTAGFSGLGGYLISVVNNTAFPHDKTVDVSWGGVKYLISPDFDVTGAIYNYDQNAYGAVKCSNASAGNCSGDLWAYSVRFDYRWTKRFDTYAGAMYSKVENGLASGYLKTNTVDPMVGFRFQF